MINLKIVKTLAKKEFMDAIRDSWTPIIAGIFAVISLAISYFGLVNRGQTGLQNFEVTIASLTSMVIYIVPLIALILGYSAISGEREQGSLAVLLSQPLTRGEIIIGKFMGLALVLTTATILGFGITGFLIYWRVGSNGWVHYLYFLLSSLALGFVFLSMGLLISVLAKKKAGAAAGAVFLWFFFTFIFDLMLLGLIMFLGNQIKITWLAALLFLNPGDIFRLINLLHLQNLRITTGLVNLISPNLMNGWLLGVLLTVWITSLLVVTVYNFSSQDI